MSAERSATRESGAAAKSALLIFCESGAGPPPIEWVGSVMQRQGVPDSGRCEIQTMEPGSVPSDLAGAVGLYARARELGKVDDFGDVETFEGGATPDGRRFAALAFK